MLEMDILFNKMKIKYEALDRLIAAGVPEITPKSKINLFIDLDSVIYGLYRKDIDQYVNLNPTDRTHQIMANVCNLIAHYRAFFTKNKHFTNVYLYTGFPFTNRNYINKSHVSSYRENMAIKNNGVSDTSYISTALTNCIPLIKILLQYVEGVHLITTNIVEPSLVPAIIMAKKTFDPTTINFIITKDRYAYQYVNKGFYILRPKGPDSYIVSPRNAIDIIKLEDKVSVPTLVTPSMLKFILSISGDAFRSIPKIKGVGTSRMLMMMNKAIEKMLISVSTASITQFASILDKSYVDTFMSNIKVTDLDTQLAELSIAHTHSIESQLIDRIDNVSLRSINDTYFSIYPIYLTELTSNVNISVKKNVFSNRGSETES